MYEDQDLDNNKHQISETNKASRIVNYLYYLGYEPENELDAIRIIQEKNISLDGYELPYNASSIEEWKKHEEETDKKAMKLNRKKTDCTNSILWWD